MMMNKSNTLACRKLPNSPKRGLTVIEAVVSAGLLLVVMSFVVRMTFHVDGLWRDISQHRLAMNELSNQLDRLTTLPASELEQELKSLAVSEPVQRSLPHAELQSEIVQDALGTRLKLSLSWQRPTPSKPVSMMAWVREPRPASNAEEGDVAGGPGSDAEEPAQESEKAP